MNHTIPVTAQNLLRTAALGWALLCLPTARAVVFFEEDFETTSLHARGWSTDSCSFMGYTTSPPAGCNPHLTTEAAHSGSRSLKGDFTGNFPSTIGCNTTPAKECGVWIYKTFQPTNEIWQRIWMKYVNFTFKDSSNKVLYNYATDNYPSYVWGHAHGDPKFLVGVQNIPTQTCPSGNIGNTCTFPQNAALTFAPNNQWICMETHFSFGTAGQSDGLAELFINGTTKAMGWYNRPFLQPGEQDKTNQIKIIVQAGAGVIYYDDYAVGDTRIGCGSAPLPPPADTTPPASPKGLTLL